MTDWRLRLYVQKRVDFSSVNWDETVVQRYWVAEADFFFS